MHHFVAVLAVGNNTGKTWDIPMTITPQDWWNIHFYVANCLEKKMKNIFALSIFSRHSDDKRNCNLSPVWGYHQLIPWLLVAHILCRQVIICSHYIDLVLTEYPGSSTRITNFVDGLFHCRCTGSGRKYRRKTSWYTIDLLQMIDGVLIHWPTGRMTHLSQECYFQIFEYVFTDAILAAR